MSCVLRFLRLARGRDGLFCSRRRHGGRGPIRQRTWAGGLLLLLALPAFAHDIGKSRLSLQSQADGTVELYWDVSVVDAARVLGLDIPIGPDGGVDLAPILPRQQALFAYAEARLHLDALGRPCVLAPRPPLLQAERPSGISLVLHFAGACPRGGDIVLSSALMLDLDAAHRSLLRVRVGDGDIRSGVLSAEHPRYRLETGYSAWQTAWAYFREGVHHVLNGWDHLLFLLGLFLPVALWWDGRTWRPLASPLQALRHASGVVTAFTVAHAATLFLTAAGVMALPSRWVESAVAASVLATGLNNLRPVVTRRLWLIAAAFGLVHGSAIAGALVELGLPAQGRVWALLGFNVGVEAAQLGLLLVCLPLALWFRRSPGYVALVLKPGSLLVCVAGLAWLLNRAMNLGWRLPG